MEEMFEVTKILNANTFEVTPFWEWHDENGVLIHAMGYKAPVAGEPGYEQVKGKLMELLFGERVTLTDAIAIEDDALVCKVHLDGINLAEYMHEYG
jgi:hypothetical protein